VVELEEIGVGSSERCFVGGVDLKEVREIRNVDKMLGKNPI
jgi:hypothetical protein